jgi:hypothetical protein
MMRIILQGGPCDGDKEDLRDVVKEFSKDGNVYKIMDGFFIDGRHFFQFDKQATEARKHERRDSLRTVECPRCHHRFVQDVPDASSADAARTKTDP